MDRKKSTAPILSKTLPKNARDLNRRKMLMMSRAKLSSEKALVRIKIMLLRLRVYNLKRKQKDHLLHLKQLNM